MNLILLDWFRKKYNGSKIPKINYQKYQCHPNWAAYFHRNPQNHNQLFLELDFLDSNVLLVNQPCFHSIYIRTVRYLWHRSYVPFRFGTFNSLLAGLGRNRVLCMLWQYRLWRFQVGGTKLERFLSRNQHTQRK